MTQKRVFITGAAQRIGAALVHRLARDGYDVVLHYGTSQAQAQAIQNTLQAQGRSCDLIQGDLTKPEAIQAILQAAIPLAPFDLMIHNASLFVPDTLATVTWQGLTDHLAVNALAPLMLIQGLADKTDHIVTLLDAHVHWHHQDFLSYTLGKHLLSRLTVDLAPVLAPKTRINGIALGPTLRGVRESEAHFHTIIQKSNQKQASSVDDVYAAVMGLHSHPTTTGAIINMDEEGCLQNRETAP
ncbi:MAG: SDR family NAD(P)-dependent oxidoreductase [Alphaproteobacteria bacterium]